MLIPNIKLLDGAGQLPIHFQIKNNIKHSISSGHLPPNAQLPSVRELAVALNVAANTVARAYKELQDEGLLVTHAGKGTFVADVIDSNPSLLNNRSTLEDILRPAVMAAKSIGFGRDEILGTVESFLEDRRLTVGLIGISEVIVKKWKRILEEHLHDIDLVVVSATLSEFYANRDATMKRFEDVYYVFNLITTYAEARSLFRDQNKKIVALITEISMRTYQALENLPEQEQIGLVCEDMYVNNLISLISPYCDISRIVRVSPQQVKDVERLMQNMNVVLHTLSPFQLVYDLALPHNILIEMEFLPNQACMEQIHAMLHQEAFDALAFA
jgi:DNA-binding transcriptional regulator YhcF (GntR family)